MSRLFVGMLTLVPSLLAGPVEAEAAVRKCTENNLTDAPFITGKLMVMINGEMVGEMYPGAVNIAYIDGDVVRSAPEDILHIQITCLEHVGDTGPVVTQVVSIVTRRGAERLARQYLRELLALQAAYRRDNGRFANDAGELRFFIRRAPLPLAIDVTDTGWRASIGQPGIICNAAGGVRAASRPECVDPAGKPIATAGDRSAWRAVLRASPVH